MSAQNGLVQRLWSYSQRSPGCRALGVDPQHPSDEPASVLLDRIRAERQS